MKKYLLLYYLICCATQIHAQAWDCTFKQPNIHLHFGTNNNSEENTVDHSSYVRTQGNCPRDGYYTYTSYTSDCFRGDWHSITEDHTTGDVDGNMLIVNSSYYEGSFFTTTLKGLKKNTRYEFAVWLMNVCKITRKCPFPLLPDLTIKVQTLTGTTLASFNTGEIARRETAQWKRYHAFFTTPRSSAALKLVMINNNPGGCGNDFALDDITVRECTKQPPIVSKKPVKASVTKKQTPAHKPAIKKTTPPPVNKTPTIATLKRTQQDNPIPQPKLHVPVFPSPPAVLRRRENTLVKKIETEAGEMRISLYDNGEIDGDTISIYHNNKLLVSKARLSDKPISFTINVRQDQPLHELVMVAENLGSIPPNTSVMIVNAGDKRYEVFISSTEQKNAKVIINLKQ